MFATDRPTGNDPLMGPVDLEYARNCLRGLSAKSFLERYRRPALLLSLSAAGQNPADSKLGHTIRASYQASTMQAGIALIAARSSSPHRPEYDIRLRQRVTIGRSADADITIRVNTVSSLHASFELIGGDWTIVDNGSTNGTSLGDRVLDAGKRHILASGDTIKFGPDLSAQFLMPRDLVHYILS